MPDPCGRRDSFLPRCLRAPDQEDEQMPSTVVYFHFKKVVLGLRHVQKVNKTRRLFIFGVGPVGPLAQWEIYGLMTNPD